MTYRRIGGNYPRGCGWPLVSLVWLMVVGLALAAAAVERQKSNGGPVPAAVARLTPVGDLAASQRLNLDRVRRQ